METPRDHFALHLRRVLPRCPRPVVVGDLAGLVAVKPAPRNPALDDYLGLWVAVTDGVVVASAPTSRELVPAVKELPVKVQRRAVAQYAHPPWEPPQVLTL